MTSRVAAAIDAARAGGRGAFVGYLPLGFPDLQTSIEAAVTLAENGADVLELGPPYSDPVMDGTVIQEATQAALAAGFRLPDTFTAVREITRRVDVPVLVMTYWNPVLQYGVDRYADALACFGRAWQQLPAGAAPPWLHDLVVRRLHALKCEGRHAQALAEAEAGMAAWADSPDFFFALGDVLLDWASRQPAWADRLLPTLETAWLRCLALGERPDLEGAVAGRGSHLAATNLALLYEVLGQPAEAARMRARAHPANDLATTRPGMAPLPPVSPATGPRPAPLECLP